MMRPLGLVLLLASTLPACNKSESSHADLAGAVDQAGTDAATFDSATASDLSPDALAAPDLLSSADLTVPDTTPPIVLSTVPANAAGDVAGDTPIVLQFSEGLQPATVTPQNIHLNAGLPATVSYDALLNTVTVTPTPAVPDGTPVVVTVETGVTDVAGNPIATRYQAYYWTTTPTETRIDTGGAQRLESSVQAFDANGNGLVAWMRRSPDDGNLAIVSRSLYDATAMTWSAPEVVATVNNNWPYPKLLARTADTQLLLVVEAPASSGNTITAYTHECTVVTTSCTWSKASQAINTASVAISTSQIGSAGRAGRFVVAWRTTDSKLLASIYESNAWAAPVELSANAADEEPQVTANKDLLAIGFRENTNLVVYTYRAAFAKQSSITDTGEQLRLTGGINQNGDLWLTWVASVSSHKQLFARRHYLDGSSVPQWEATTQLSATATNVESYDVAARGTSNFAAAWVEGNGTTGTLMVRRYQSAAWVAADSVKALTDQAYLPTVALFAVGQDLAAAVEIQGGLFVVSYNDAGATWTATAPALDPGPNRVDRLTIAGRAGSFYLAWGKVGSARDDVYVATGDVATGVWTTSNLAGSVSSARLSGLARDGGIVHALYELDGELVHRRSPNFGVATVLSSAADNPSPAYADRILSNGQSDSLLFYQQDTGDGHGVWMQRLVAGVPSGAPTQIINSHRQNPDWRATPLGDGYLVVYRNDADATCQSFTIAANGTIGATTQVETNISNGGLVNLAGSSGKAYVVVQRNSASSVTVLRWDGAWTLLGTIAVDSNSLSSSNVGVASMGGDARVVYVKSDKAMVVQPAGDALDTPVELGSSAPTYDLVTAGAAGGRYYYTWASKDASSECQARVEGASLGVQTEIIPDGADNGQCELTLGPSRAAASWSIGGQLFAKIYDGASWSSAILIGDTTYARIALPDPKALFWFSNDGVTLRGFYVVELSGLTAGAAMVQFETSKDNNDERQVALGDRQAQHLTSLQEPTQVVLHAGRSIDGLLLPWRILATYEGDSGFGTATWDGTGFAQVASHVATGGKILQLWAIGWR